ncbi:MAG: division/cell wall cluster transcriptional repressor MraZ [Clostridia bacterium]|nr:division/cell wall cluster transcriptional repressor MraZ [Clostridia bacterium]
MELFCREYRYSLDAKNRIFVPAKYREILGDTFIITRRLDTCLALYTNEEWEKYSEKIKALPDSVAMELKRFIFPKTLVAEPDSQGRVIIPNDLKEYAQLEKNAVIIGVGDHAEIWSESLWDEREKTKDIEGLRELMRQLGL